MASLQMRSAELDEKPQELSRDGYNSCAERYFEWSSSLQAPRLKWLEKVFERLGQDSLASAKVLELGCGAGKPILVKMAQTCGEIIGTDISSTQLELARRHLAEANIELAGANVHLREADMMELEFETGTIDAICAFYSLLHLSLTDQQTIVQRCAMWLKPGGLLLFNVPAQETESGTVIEDWFGAKAFFASFGTEKALEVTKDAGLMVLENETVEVTGDSAFT